MTVVSGSLLVVKDERRAAGRINADLADGGGVGSGVKRSTPVPARGGIARRVSCSLRHNKAGEFWTLDVRGGGGGGGARRLPILGVSVRAPL